MASCRDVIEQLWDYLDGELPPERMEEIADHLAECARCYPHYRSDGTLYLPTTAAMPGEGQNGRLKEFAEQEVTVTGTVFPAGGASAIQIASIRRKS
jgi:anti-sigma factor RsiW